MTSCRGAGALVDDLHPRLARQAVEDVGQRGGGGGQVHVAPGDADDHLGRGRGRGEGHHDERGGEPHEAVYAPGRGA